MAKCHILSDSSAEYDTDKPISKLKEKGKKRKHKLGREDKKPVKKKISSKKPSIVASADICA
eukprot:14424987-Ditylum_brightwellii.AAC.1